MWKKFVNNVLKDKKKRNGLLLVAALVILTFSTDGRREGCAWWLQGGIAR